MVAETKRHTGSEKCSNTLIVKSKILHVFDVDGEGHHSTGRVHGALVRETSLQLKRPGRRGNDPWTKRTKERIRPRMDEESFTVFCYGDTKYYVLSSPSSDLRSK